MLSLGAPAERGQVQIFFLFLSWRLGVLALNHLFRRFRRLYWQGSHPVAEPRIRPATWAALAIGPSRPVMRRKSHAVIRYAVWSLTPRPRCGSKRPLIQM